jgi:hypothetical protein
VMRPDPRAAASRTEQQGSGPISIQ